MVSLDWADESRERALHGGPEHDDDRPSRSDLGQPGVGGYPWPDDLAAAIDRAVRIKRAERDEMPECEHCGDEANWQCDRGLEHCDAAECVLACGACGPEAREDMRGEWSR